MRPSRTQGALLIAGLGLSGGLLWRLLTGRLARARAASARVQAAKQEPEPTGATISSIASGGEQLYVRTWQAQPTATSTPAAPPRGIVLIIHGFSWHGAYYDPLAQQLTSKGMEVVCFDLAGHGRSSGTRGYMGSFNSAVGDAVAVLFQAITRHKRGPSTLASAPPPKVFVLAESMGGTVACALARRPEWRATIRGLVLLAPVLQVSKALLPPPPVLVMVKLLASCLPRLEVPDDSVANGFDAAFGNQEFAAKARTDPLVVFDRPRIRTAAQVLAACASNWAQLEQIGASGTALLVLHGDADTRTAPSNSQELVRRSSSTDKKLVMLPGAAHMLLYDKPQTSKLVADTIAQWLYERL